MLKLLKNLIILALVPGLKRRNRAKISPQTTAAAFVGPSTNHVRASWHRVPFS